MSYSTGTVLIDTKQLFERVQLQPGMHVADFGAGRTGHLVFPAGLVIGESGVVYAVDILKDVLENIRKRAALENYVNIQPVWADIDRPNGVAIPARSLDIIFMINVLHHAHNPAVPLGEARRLLKPKARIVVVDWIATLGNLGPSAGERLNFDAVMNWAKAANFAVQEDFAASPYHRGVILFRHD